MPFLLALFHFCLVALQSMSNLNDYNIFLCFLFFCHLHFPSVSIINSTRCLLLFIFSLHNCMNPYNDIFSSYIMCNWWFILFIYNYVFSFASHWRFLFSP
jgi:hypothetical protein